MSKNAKRVKFDAQGNPTTGKASGPVAEPSRVHKPKIERPHIAQEFRDRLQTEEAESITRGLLPHLRGRVQGLRDTHYKHAGWRSTGRRDIIAKAFKEES